MASLVNFELVCVFFPTKKTAQESSYSSIQVAVDALIAFGFIGFNMFLKKTNFPSKLSVLLDNLKIPFTIVCYLFNFWMDF